jgi:hypothetical protein
MSPTDDGDDMFPADLPSIPRVRKQSGASARSPPQVASVKRKSRSPVAAHPEDDAEELPRPTRKRRPVASPAEPVRAKRGRKPAKSAPSLSGSRSGDAGDSNSEEDSRSGGRPRDARRVAGTPGARRRGGYSDDVEEDEEDAREGGDGDDDVASSSDDVVQAQRREAGRPPVPTVRVKLGAPVVSRGSPSRGSSDDVRDDAEVEDDGGGVCSGADAGVSGDGEKLLDGKGADGDDGGEDGDDDDDDDDDASNAGSSREGGLGPEPLDLSKPGGKLIDDYSEDDTLGSEEEGVGKPVAPGARLTMRQRAMQGEDLGAELTKLASPRHKKKRKPPSEDLTKDEERAMKLQQKARLRHMVHEKRNKEKRAAMVDKVLRGVTSKRKKLSLATEAHAAEAGARLTKNTAREGCYRYTSNEEGAFFSIPHDMEAPPALANACRLVAYPPKCGRDPKTGKRILPGS